MNESSETVLCEEHGDQEEAYVCAHLLRGRGEGFFCDDDGSTPYPDAWCAACESLRVSSGGDWTEELASQIGVSLVCGKCYLEIKARNSLPDPISWREIALS